MTWTTRKRRATIGGLLFFALLVVGRGGGAQTPESVLADTAFLSVMVLEHQLGRSVNRRVPANLRFRAKCIGVFPSVVKAGLILAAKYGNGLVSCRHREDRRWGTPAVFNLTAASIGIQAGIQSASYILIFLEQDVVDSLLKGEVSFGNELSVAAGPVGAAATYVQQPDVVSYVRTSGLFAGVDLEGAVLAFDEKANASFYGGAADAPEILFETMDIPSELDLFYGALNKFAPQP